MRFRIPVFVFLATAFALGVPQSQFIGKWQTRVSRVTKKSAITVNIMEQQQSLGGTVVLVNPDASEIELPMLNVKVTDNVIEYETRDRNETFHWSLTVQKKRGQGLLHGSCREMLIDERVQKGR
jgi:hypothetical protein